MSLIPFLGIKAVEQSPTFRIMTQSDSGDYIGQNKSWDFASSNNSKISVTQASENIVSFNISSFDISWMSFGFASETGKTLSKGLYSPAKRLPFRDSFNGIDIDGDGRGCNRILGAFYVHEYVVNSGILEKAAIDFVQICEPKSNDVNESSPKLVGSLRYNSSVPDSCNSSGCSVARNNLGISATAYTPDANTSNINTNTKIITNASDLPKADAFKAIVKIKTFVLGNDYDLVNPAEGSGIIIDQKGIVLTNYHVVTMEDDFDNSIRDASYEICLIGDINKKPDCSYTAKLIAYNKDLDIALLQIQNILGLSGSNSFSFLNLNQADNTQVNEEVTALGFPELGGDTITITKGIVSGKAEKYGNQWVKTDAVISYGSSGGAAIDSKGNVIGITSQAHSDFLGSLGYIINITSINGWINSNKNKTGQESALLNRVINFAKKEKLLETSNKFENSNPPFFIVKPGDWKFDYASENGLFINKEEDEAGGAVILTFEKFPYAADASAIEFYIKRSLQSHSLSAVASILKNEDITVGGRKGKKVIISAAGNQGNYYYISAGNYIFTILYDYGENDKDKSIIDGIIKSLNISEPSKVSEVAEYANDNPKFFIRGGNGWVFAKQNSKASPLFIAYKPIKKIFADVDIIKADDNIKNFNNDEYLKYWENNFNEGNTITNEVNLKGEIIKSSANFQLNGELKNVMMTEYTNKSITTGKILDRNREYHIRQGDKIIVISINYHGDDEKGYNDAIKKFNEMLSSFSLKNNSLTLQKSATNTKSGTAMLAKLKGKIMLKVEDSGKAYYIHPSTQEMYYLGRPDDAFKVMREQGVGIKDIDLEKIPVGLSNLSGIDADKDGLSDLFEDAIGTDKNKKDTDGDGYDDKIELSSGNNPKGSGKLSINNNFSNGQKGKIFLQVEGKGEAWYINSNDGKRYFLGRPADAFNVMRNLGLGISNKDFDSMK
jgi:S1-C subfamily serine protease